MSRDDAIRALEKEVRLEAEAMSMAHKFGAERQLRGIADRIASILSDRQEVAPVAWLVEAESYRNVFLCRKHAGAELGELRRAGYEASITPLGNPYVGEAVRNDPSWPLFDRVDFALRDAGFDLDQAAEIAALATGQASDARDSEGEKYRRAVVFDALQTVKSGIEAGHIKARSTVVKVDGDWVEESVLDVVTRAIAAMESRHD